MSLGLLEAPAGLTKKHLPKHVDWRGSGADNIVKDQATCGSCCEWSAAVVSLRDLCFEVNVPLGAVDLFITC